MPSHLALIKENVRIGMHTPSDRYFWETETNKKYPLVTCSAHNFVSYAKGLRKLFVLPSQLRNSGTIHVASSHALEDNLFEQLHKYLSRPFIILSLQKPAEKIDKLLTLTYIVVYDTLHVTSSCTFQKVPRVFREFGFEEEDLMYNENPNDRVPNNFRKRLREMVLDYR